MEKINLRVGEQYELPTLQGAEVIAGHPTVGLVLYVLAEQEKVVPIRLPVRWDQALELSEKLRAAALAHPH